MEIFHSLDGIKTSKKDLALPFYYCKLLLDKIAMVLPTLIFWLRPRPMIFQYMGGSQLTTHKPLYPSGATCTLSVALCNRHVRDTCPFHLSFSSSLCTYVPFNKILILMVHPNLLYTLLLYRCTTQHKIMPQSYMGFFFLGLPGMIWIAWSSFPFSATTGKLPFPSLLFCQHLLRSR